jgi:hypothetical protein
MAEQKGHLRIKGRPGNLSFYKTRDGYLIKDKGGIDKNRMASDPKFQRMRKNGAEAFRPERKTIVQTAKDKRPDREGILEFRPPKASVPTGKENYRSGLQRQLYLTKKEFNQEGSRVLLESY